MVPVDHQPSPNCRRASQRTLTKSLGGCARTVYTWTCRRQISYGWLQVVDSTNCHGPRFELALTSCFRLPSFEISDFLLILTSRYGPTYVTPSVSTCFSVLRQLRTIHCRSVSRSVIQSLVTSLVLSRLDYENPTLAGIPQYLILSVMNAAARLVYLSSRCGHITSLLRQLHWLKAKERIDFKLAVLIYKCMHGTAPPYLADELSISAHSQARGPDFDRHHRNHYSSVALACQPSAIAYFRLPRYAYGTVCLSLSQLHLLSQHFVIALRLTCSLFLFFNLIYVYNACEVTVILDT